MNRDAQFAKRVNKSVQTYQYVHLNRSHCGVIIVNRVNRVNTVNRVNIVNTVIECVKTYKYARLEGPCGGVMIYCD